MWKILSYIAVAGVVVCGCSSQSTASASQCDDLLNGVAALQSWRAAGAEVPSAEADEVVAVLVALENTQVVRSLRIASGEAADPAGAAATKWRDEVARIDEIYLSGSIERLCR